MSGAGGWSPVREPRDPRSPDVAGSRRVTNFMRLARVHALSAAGDAMIAVALADSLFFSVDPDAARSRVLLYLFLTLTPFAVVAPLIGPAVDRAPGGRRLLIVLLNAGRTMTVFFMIGNLDSGLLFPLAFAALVLGKGYAVAKASVVPATARSETELVNRNSRLAVLSGVAGLVGGVPAWLIQRYAGSDWVMGVATAVFLGACVLSLKLPRADVEPGAARASEDAASEIRGFGIRLAASGTAVLRGVLGFMTFLVAFGLRDDALWQVYLVGAFAMIGVLSGSAVAARMRSGGARGVDPADHAPGPRAGVPAGGLGRRSEGSDRRGARGGSGGLGGQGGLRLRRAARRAERRLRPELRTVRDPVPALLGGRFGSGGDPHVTPAGLHPDHPGAGGCGRAAPRGGEERPAGPAATQPAAPPAAPPAAESAAARGSQGGAEDLGREGRKTSAGRRIPSAAWDRADRRPDRNPRGPS